MKSPKIKLYNYVITRKELDDIIKIVKGNTNYQKKLKRIEKRNLREFKKAQQKQNYFNARARARYRYRNLSKLNEIQRDLEKTLELNSVQKFNKINYRKSRKISYVKALREFNIHKRVLEKELKPLKKLLYKRNIGSSVRKKFNIMYISKFTDKAEIIYQNFLNKKVPSVEIIKTLMHQALVSKTAEMLQYLEGDDISEKIDYINVKMEQFARNRGFSISGDEWVKLKNELLKDYEQIL